MEIEIGIGKSGRKAYGFDDIAIVPSRRTRDPDDVDISWEIDAFTLDLPLMASAMDGVVSPRMAIEIGRLGGLAVLNLEGLQTRYEDADQVLAEIAEQGDDKATLRMQEIYQEPVKEELIYKRIREIKDAGITAVASLTPQKVEGFHKDSSRGGARHAGDPGHGRLGRARVDQHRAPQPQDGSSRPTRSPSSSGAARRIRPRYI